MIDPFHYESARYRVRFGSGTLSSIADEARAAGILRALVLSTPEQRALARTVFEMLGDRAAGLFGEAAMHTPVAVTQRALDQVDALSIDGIVSIGGGSTIGLGKAISIRTGLPHIVVPTTYAGSEMTPILGETEDGRKTTRRDIRIQPAVVIYDVALTTSLPTKLSITSGLNAMAHAVEALYSVDANPIISLVAEEGIRAMGKALPRILRDATGQDARSEALYGAWLCGTCLGQTSMALHHKLCHTLGGTYGLPHAETHGVILPHAVAYNAAAAPVAMSRIARALGVTGDPATALHELAARLGAPLSLAELGFAERDVAEAADLAASQPYPNPGPIDRGRIERLLHRAWAGEAPQA